MTNREIATVMERTKLAIVSKLSRLGMKRPIRNGNEVGEWDTIRPCLSCGREFPSKGKTNRICKECKKKSGWDTQGNTIELGTGADKRMKLPRLSEEGD